MLQCIQILKNYSKYGIFVLGLQQKSESDFLRCFFTFLVVMRIWGDSAGHSWYFLGEQTCSVGSVSRISYLDLARQGGVALVSGLSCVRMNKGTF